MNVVGLLDALDGKYRFKLKNKKFNVKIFKGGFNGIQIIKSCQIKQGKCRVY